MARSRLTYREAVRLLTGGSDVTAVLGRLAGGALLVAAPFAGSALALLDAKGEANQLLRDLVGRAPDRIRASRGKAHYELIEAAHTVLVLSSFFDALEELHGDELRTVELTDDEKHRIGTLHPLRDELEKYAPPMLVADDKLALNVTRDYVACRAAEAFEGEDAEAFAALRDRA